MSIINVAHGAEHRLHQASQTVYKYFLAGRSILVYCSDPKRLNGFSKLLWSVESTAFVPHPPLEDIVHGELPSLIHTCTTMPTNIRDYYATDKPLPWLLNLDTECPPGYEQFDRVLEIVSQHEQDKAYARARMAQYKQGNHKMVFYQLNQ